MRGWAQCSDVGGIFFSLETVRNDQAPGSPWVRVVCYKINKTFSRHITGIML